MPPMQRDGQRHTLATNGARALASSGHGPGANPCFMLPCPILGSGGHSSGDQSNHRGKNLAARPSNSAQKRGACAVAFERCWRPGGESWHC
jgi:hypothetical protein